MNFYKAVLAKGGCFWKGKIDHECSYIIDPMHIIPKQWLKNRYQYDIEPSQLAELVFDPRNGTPGCRHIHDRIDGFRVRIGRSELPEDAVAFADCHDLAWKLDELYPGKDELT